MQYRSQHLPSRPPIPYPWAWIGRMQLAAICNAFNGEGSHENIEPVASKNQRDVENTCRVVMKHGQQQQLPGQVVRT